MNKAAAIIDIVLGLALVCEAGLLFSVASGGPGQLSPGGYLILTALALVPIVAAGRLIWRARQ